MQIKFVADHHEDSVLGPTIIKAIGIGGGGGNAIDRMIEKEIKGVDFGVINTDLQALRKARAKVKLPIGSKLTGGLGAGGVPEKGEKAAEENAEDIKALLKGTDMVFLTAGMGGGTGTGAIPVVARIAREQEILTVAVVTKPFEFEGGKKLILATQGIDRLRKEVDTLIVIPNEHLFKVIDKKTPVKKAFLMVDDVLRQGIQGISELITEPGDINIDFADVQTIMEKKGDALMGVGLGKGENRTSDASLAAIENPLLEDARIDGAQGILVGVTGGEDLSMEEYREVVKIISSNAHKDALIIPGMTMSPSMDGTLKVTVVATGFTHGPASPASKKPKEDDDREEVVSQKDWQTLKGRGGEGSPNYLMGRNSPQSHLGIPTVLRDGSRDQDAFKDFEDGGKE